MVASKEVSFITRARRNIIFGTLIFILSLGLPLFLYTTLIHRAQLPIDEVVTNTANFQDTVRFKVPVYVTIDPSHGHLVDVWQKKIDEANLKQGLNKNWALQLRQEDGSPLAEDSYVLNIDIKESHGENSYKVLSNSKAINIALDSGDSGLEFVPEVLLNNIFGDERRAIQSILNGGKGNDESDIVFPYSNTYNIVFNLFVENGKPVAWDIEEAVEAMNPVFEALKDYANFKVSTQIQYYSKLRSSPSYDEGLKANILKKDELPTFINFGDWNLYAHDINPSINFILFFSKSNYEKIPLIVEGSTTNSFLIPQWGGVHIFNNDMPVLGDSVFKLSARRLQPIFEIFTSQLFELIGVPKHPESPWIRIDSLKRITTLKNLKRSLENLSSLIKLSNSLNEISIPESTKLHAEQALRFYNQSIESLEELNFENAIKYASQSVESSDKAFFEKEMVQQAYFPSEHKLAVFLPLLGPLCSIVLIGVLKALKDRKSKVQSEEEQKKKDE